MISKTHHFFLLDISPWPIIISLNCFNAFFSLMIFFKKTLVMNFSASIITLALCSILWWMNYSKEFNISGLMSRDLESGLKFSMLLFISSEVFFFFSFFWAYFHFFLSPCLETSLMWPASQTKMFDYTNVPMVNTLILLTSGVTITVSHFYALEGQKTLALSWSLVTGVLGLAFTALQVQEYFSSFFSISDGTFGTSFFMLTGFHGLHVMIGSTYIIINFLYFYKFSYCDSSVVSFELASWYWHFVDVVWIFLYFFLYYLNF